MKKLENNNLQSGQALVALLFFVIMATIFSSAAVIVIAVNSQAATKMQQGVITSSLAESATENAIINLLRDPDYAGGTFNFADGDATVVVTGNGAKIVNVEATSGSFTRKVEVVVDDSTGILEVSSWREVF